MDRGWWIAIAAVVVVQPDRISTKIKSLNRVIGMILGSVTATVAALVLPLNALTVAGVVGITVAIGWRIPRLREPLPLAGITALLVFILDRQNDSIDVGLWRTVQIIIGVLIGLLIAAIPLPGEKPWQSLSIANSAGPGSSSEKHADSKG